MSCLSLVTPKLTEQEAQKTWFVEAGLLGSREEGREGWKMDLGSGKQTKYPADLLI